MIDALLHAVRDAIRSGGFDYDARSCEIMDDDHPPPRCGDWFVSVHEGPSSSQMDNALDEYFSFILTLTARVRGVPLDRIGDQLLARKLARRAGPKGAPSFNARIEQLRGFLHMNWGVLQDANNNLVALEPDAMNVYGFCEPARYRGADNPVLVGGEWFGAEPEADDVGLKADMRFEDCRRLQAFQTFT